MKKLLLLLLLISTSAMAWTPSKQINVIIPFAPGSGNEASFRLVATKIEKEKNVSFVIHNMPGADGNIGMNHFVEQPADGTWIAAPSCQNSFLAEALWPESMRYNPAELTPITTLAKSPVVFIANRQSSINSPTDLVKAIKTNQRPLFFAVGAANHKLVFAYLLDKLSVTNKNVSIVPYKSPGVAAMDVGGNHVELGIVSLSIAKNLSDSGKIKIIGIAGEEPISGFETISLMKDTVPGLVSNACFDLVLPPKTTPEIQKWFVDAFVGSLKSKSTQKLFEENFFIVDRSALGPDGMLKDLEKLKNHWSKYIKDVSILTN